MNRQRQRPRLHISHGPKKKVEYEQPPNLGCLSPDLQPCSPPTFCHESESGASNEKYIHIGKYVVHQVSASQDTCTAVDTATGDEYKCKVSTYLMVSISIKLDLCDIAFLCNASPPKALIKQYLSDSHSIMFMPVSNMVQKYIQKIRYFISKRALFICL